MNPYLMNIKGIPLLITSDKSKEDTKEIIDKMMLKHPNWEMKELHDALSPIGIEIPIGNVIKTFANVEDLFMTVMSGKHRR